MSGAAADVAAKDWPAPTGRTRSRFGDVHWLEYRADRPYDEQFPGSIVMPDGSVVASLDRVFLGAALRERMRWEAA